MSKRRGLRAGAYLVALAMSLGLAPVAHANSLTVSPTSITVRAPQMTGLLTLKAGGRELTHGQIRVMKMDIKGGKEVLTPTTDVVASPPAMRLQPNQEVTIRLVRTSKSAVRARECYRVLVDQLPQRSPQGGTVGFVIRQSIPLCFVAGG
jgi:fimbrial chaperone protein